MQWLYNLLHLLFTILFSWLGKVWWLIKNSITFRIAVIMSIFGVFVILWRMFYYGVRTISSYLVDLPTFFSEVSSVSSVGDMLDVANFLFPVEESLAMYALLISYGVICLTIRIVRAFIPTMT